MSELDSYESSTVWFKFPTQSPRERLVLSGATEQHNLMFD